MTLQLIVSKLARASCLHTLTTAIKKIDAKANTKADTKTKIISVETQTSETVLKKAIACSCLKIVNSM
jgi:copper chaperone